jgi:pimeloyl-ACP methyl ester carboxylesterase
MLEALEHLHAHYKGWHAMANIVLVHGAFADGSSWSKVIPLLHAAGHRVIAVQLPLDTLSGDIAVTRKALDSLNGPTVLAAHSYGGAVISGAGTGQANVQRLVFVAAYAPAEGETVLDLNNRFPATAGLSAIRPSYLDNKLWIDPDAFPQYFVGDIDEAEGRALAAVQKPVGIPCNTEAAGPAAWQTIPSYYIVSENDQTVSPDLERFFADRMKATTSTLAASHASPVSHPREVAEVILQAAQGL